MVDHWLLFMLFPMPIHLVNLTVLFLTLLAVRMLVLDLGQYISIPRDVVIESYILGGFYYINILIVLRLPHLLRINPFLSRVYVLLLRSNYLLLINWHVKISLSDSRRVRSYFLLSSNFTRLYRIDCLIGNLALVGRVRRSRIHSGALRLRCLLLVHIHAEVLIVSLLILV